MNLKWFVVENFLSAPSELEDRLTTVSPSVTGFDDVAPRIASFNDGELAKEDIP